MATRSIIDADKASEVASFMVLDSFSLSYDSIGQHLWPTLAITFRPHHSGSLKSTILFVEVVQLELKLDSAEPSTEEVLVLSITERQMEGLNFQVKSDLGTMCFSLYCKQILHQEETD